MRWPWIFQLEGQGRHSSKLRRPAGFKSSRRADGLTGVFKDDPLRLLRAFTLRATLGFKIEGKTTAKSKKTRI